MAQLTLFMDAELGAVVEHRRIRSEAGDAPGFTDYVIAATARALRRHPIVNSTVRGTEIAVLPEIHMGMAVALDDGLIVPVIHNADRLSLGDLHDVTSRLAQTARDGSLDLDDLDGGTFSVSTLGMFGVDGFTPVINPPNAAILGVGRLRDDATVDGDNVVSTKRMTLSLTWDHRVFDGAPAAAFCREIVDLLADPESLDAID
jgi:pyruvate dehydrogenase E2 component (dihydrolipoamide acetyltransferase)